LSHRYSSAATNGCFFILRAGKYIIFLICINILLCHNVLTAQDSTSVPVKPKRKLVLSPMKATMLSAALPGFGQIYNRKYWKIPLVYAGFGAVGYSLVYNLTNYNNFIKAYQDFTDKIPATDSYLKLIRGMSPSEYDPVLFPKTALAANTETIKEGLLRQVDYYRKYRDLSYFGIAAWYIISILDANVDASLSDYDISDNINLTLAPAPVPNYYFTGLGMNLCLRINF
jgi:hypothetical protein